MTRDRTAAERKGRRAETWAALYLRLKGYRIHARRVRTRAGEVDIVAQRGRTLVFVEVKWRPTDLAADAAIAPGRLARVHRAAEALWPRYSAAADGARVDAVLVRPGRWPLHLKGLF
ncbi:YraN family protein [Pacificimonas flava]|uniref:UPF0102 protein C725_0924 n=1 Tax=Pacificimonas flava TaxID=1234595 RepID=M2U7G6_9SPHN|nr:YraN family protein [Pacificimonas flava]EMD83952.1 hypothetical protein C725_0924 [Pacificimonas flava]MBB5281075.1 putative endonuclease [Pacificimonas flava]